jgi:hypothetical protein
MEVKWLNSSPSSLSSEKELWCSIGGWVSHRACLEVLEHRKITCPYVDSNPKLSSPLPSYYTDCITLDFKGKK